MKFSFVTLFPELIKGYFTESILKRAIEDEKISIDFYNPRDFTTDKHNRVDAPMIGGGAGMLMTPQPLMDTLDKIKEVSPKAHIVFLSPVAKPFKQNDARRLAQKEHVVLVSGRYEGIDERIIQSLVDEEWSIGDYVISGGEFAALVVVEAITRLIPGVLGDDESALQDSFMQGLLDYPHYTRPEIIDGQAVPEELLSGDHQAIRRWRLKQALGRTWLKRPDLLDAVKNDASNWDKEKESLLVEFIAEHSGSESA